VAGRNHFSSNCGEREHQRESEQWRDFAKTLSIFARSRTRMFAEQN